MLILDTHAFLFDALSPERLSAAALQAIEEGEGGGQLAVSDITLWEVSMLVHKRRIDLGEQTARFLKAALVARSIRVLPITPEIAEQSQSPEWTLGDPVDKIIAATAVRHRAKLVTCDERLRAIVGLNTLW